MKTIGDLKERLKKDKEFKRLFANKRDINELIKVARENGYDVCEKDLEEDEALSEDALEAVAGGSKKEVIKEDIEVYEHNRISFCSFRTSIPNYFRFKLETYRYADWHYDSLGWQYYPRTIREGTVS